jgi:hypothetical protein
MKEKKNGDIFFKQRPSKFADKGNTGYKQENKQNRSGEQKFSGSPRWRVTRGNKIFRKYLSVRLDSWNSFIRKVLNN